MVISKKSNKTKDIESIYPLSPTQEGMLFHTLYHPESYVYFDQFCLTLQGKLDIAAFQQAWQKILDRHPIFRTLFIWKNRKQPLQVVRKQVKLPWVNHDWRSLSKQELETRIDAFLEEDRKQGLTTDQAPLMRCNLIRVSDDNYQLIWSFHHLLCDGWSWPIILQEIFTFYDAIKQGNSINLPSPRPYQDYINWLQQQDKVSAENFWKKNLKGFKFPISLNQDKSCQKTDKTYNIHQRKLSTSLTNQLKSFATQNHLTLSTLVQAAWALLLSRYSQEKDIVFGTVVSGRTSNLSGIESMVGLFINTLPTRIKVPKDTKIIPWLHQIQEQHIEGEQYSYSSLVDIQGWSDISRNDSLFETILAFENYPTTTTFQELPDGLKIINMEDIGQTNYPLVVRAIPFSEMALMINYEENYFDFNTIDRMLGHLQTLLEEIIINPYRFPKDIVMLTQAERKMILNEWNNTLSLFPINQCVHQLFEKQVKKTPNAVAVVYENQSLTYQQLNQKANQLAHYLHHLGVKADSLVAICLERSLDIAVAIVATLKAGGACVPIDPNYPEERINFILEDSTAKIILTQDSCSLILSKENSHHLIILEHQWDEISQELSHNLDVQIDDSHLAYLIYTSGSTGIPKGVAVPHRSLTNLVEHHRDKMLTGGSVLQFASFSFDVSYHEMVAAWCFGGTLYIASEETRLDLDKLVDLLANHSIEKAILPVTLWQQIAELYGDKIYLFNNLKEAIAAGEQLQITPPMIAMFKQLKKCRLYNFYGPSEADLVTAYAFSEYPEQWPLYPPIGKPAINVKVYLLDEDLHPVPLGRIGELYVSGAGLARGYFNRPELTTKKFISNPFCQQNKNIYKTGDLARYLPDGNIEFLGRIDDRVKIRGYSVELGELEAALNQHPSLSQGTVKVYGTTATDKYLCAYFVPLKTKTITMEELRDFLTEQLPEYMIPSVFISMESLPLTSNGKVDRKKLPEPTSNRPELIQNYVVPNTPTEEILTVIWQDILGLTKVGIYDNFFTLGGHSLLATQVIAIIRKTFNLELPIKNLFDSPTIALLAKDIEKNTNNRNSQPIISNSLQLLQNQLIPISLNQLEFWFFEQFYPRNSVYNLPLIYQIKGKLNITILEKSLKEIVKRHEILRTTFIYQDGQVLQKINPEIVLDFSIVNLQNLSEKEQEKVSQKLASEEIYQPFDLEKGSLFRSKLFQLSDDNFLFVVTMHHIISDGWSFGIFIRELGIIYEAFCQSKPSPLTELPIQYADFAFWQWQSRNQKSWQPHLDFWKQYIGVNPPILNLPTDYPRPQKRTFKGDTYPIPISSELTNALKVLSQQEQSTLYMTLLSAFKLLLFYYTQQEDIIIGGIIANRNRPETQDLIGFFVNLLPIYTNLDGNPSFRELLRRVREASLGVYSHQEIPFIELIEYLKPRRDPRYLLLTQVGFIFHNSSKTDLKMADLTLKEYFLDTNTKEADTAEFDLTMSLEETNQGVDGYLVYRSDLFAPITIAKMGQHFHQLLENIITNPEEKLSKLSPLSTQEYPPVNSLLTAVNSIESTNVIEPRNSTEKVLAHIWKKVLGLEQVGIYDNFFELGGTSHQVLQVMNELSKKTKKNIPLCHFFEQPTIENLATIIKINQP
ncbi:non-ribosomal peptide synthetase [Crocosphaera sp. XPORK-15E]|uniref:non-ribosomal peptide synthetase n=1 Tax=Crocosphaera sp. XPORK-15E TaxID=3110247 RepID=UPI002B207144|nr:non-ribosomal peptide synthetase [Crocosphaera sp. XPORK-15E]MEA5536727.1 amino acid adenylation domain-containing protein [Crocosphaera sp. XPORK-15E]